MKPRRRQLWLFPPYEQALLPSLRPSPRPVEARSIRRADADVMRRQMDLL